MPIRTHTVDLSAHIKLALIIILFTFFNACDAKKALEDIPPVLSENPIIIEKAKPIALTTATIDEFINWASGSEFKEREIVRKAIHEASKNEEVLKVLFGKYNTVATKDFGYSLIVLSIIGEMQNPGSLPFFETIIFQEIPEEIEQFHSGLTQKDVVEILVSKAIECATYLKTEESDQLSLKVASGHTSIAARSTAIDAYLYNHGDSQEAKNKLKGIIKDKDAILIDRARFTRNSTKEEFNDKINTFYKKNPSEVPPKPEIIRTDINQKDSTQIKFVQAVDPPKRKQQ